LVAAADHGVQVVDVLDVAVADGLGVLRGAGPVGALAAVRLLDAQLLAEGGNLLDALEELPVVLGEFDGGGWLGRLHQLEVEPRVPLAVPVNDESGLEGFDLERLGADEV